MEDKSSGIESSAVSVLKRAVDLDQNMRYADALICYQEGLQLLIQASKNVMDDTKKQHFRKKITDYMERAEKLKEFNLQEKNLQENSVNQILIKNDSKGNSYDTIFGKYLTMNLTQVIIEDPYIRSNHQINNFLKFCELLLKSKSPIANIQLKTSYDAATKSEQIRKLNLIKSSLNEHEIDLDVTFSETLHDREITLNNGWRIKIGRGLDYFKKVEKFSMGTFDYDLRPCYETTIDIYKIN